MKSFEHVKFLHFLNILNHLNVLFISLQHEHVTRLTTDMFHVLPRFVERLVPPIHFVEVWIRSCRVSLTCCNLFHRATFGFPVPSLCNCTCNCMVNWCSAGCTRLSCFRWAMHLQKVHHLPEADTSRRGQG